MSALAIIALGYAWKAALAVLPVLVARYASKANKTRGEQVALSVFELAWRAVEGWKAGRTDVTPEGAEKEFLAYINAWRASRKEKPLAPAATEQARSWANLRSNAAKYNGWGIAGDGNGH